MKYVRVRLLVASLLVLPAALLARPSSEAKDSWIGIYMGGKKIGYSSLHIEDGSYKSKSAKKIDSHSVVTLEMLGNKVSQDVTTLTFADSSFTPLYQEYTIKSNGSAMNLKAEYSPTKILCTINGTSEKTVDIPPGATIVGDDTSASLGKSLQPGAKKTYYFLSPLTVSLEKIELEAQHKEAMKVAGKSFESVRVSAKTSMGNMLMWQDSHGEMIKGEMSLGPITMMMFTEPKQIALDLNSKMPQITAASGGNAAPYTPPSDFAIATAITPTKKIEKPRETRKLVVVISGLSDKSLVLSDERQIVESDKAGVYQYTITAQKFDETGAAQIPVSGATAKNNLSNAAFLDTDNPSVTKVAADIRGNETNSWRVATAIRAWVHGKMTPDYSMGVPRSCPELLTKPRGVCRDYATLFAGIARAAGVPTRLAAGIVYAEGRFFYHAWVECYVGKWISLDPTLGNDFVDATHIKFAQGDVTEMYNVARVVGRMKIEVVSAE